jgi:hypothetical protein
MTNLLGGLNAPLSLASAVDPVLASGVSTATGIAGTAATTLASVVHPISDPIVGGVASAANMALDKANAAVASVVNTGDGLLQTFAPVTEHALHPYLAPATGELHLPVSGDVLAPLLTHGGEQQAGSMALNASADTSMSADPGSHAFDLGGLLDHLSV